MAEEIYLEYIRVKLQELLNDFASAALESLPKDPQRFMLEWLQSHSKPSLTPAEISEMKNLKRELESLKSDATPVKASGSESSESSSDEVIEEKLLPLPKNKFRTSVSAEAYGSWNKKSSFMPRAIIKSNEQRQRIIEVINKCFMFSPLDRQEREVLILAFEERRLSPGERAIQQGNDGNELFVVDSGKLACYKRFAKDQDEKFLKFYGPGEAFGELSLLYNVPRAASIEAVTDCVCWVLDRDCFNNIVKEAAQKKREKYESFLSQINLFKDIDAYERSQMADALQSITFEKGEFVIREGEVGDTFFIIEDGDAVALKNVPGLPPKEVFEYKGQGYFGELAILKDAPRAASVMAKTNLQCAMMDRRAFKRLLGPLEEILKRNASGYQGYNF